MNEFEDFDFQKKYGYITTFSKHSGNDVLMVY